MRELWPFVLIDFVLFAISVWCLYKAKKAPYSISPQLRFWGILFFLLLCVFAFYDADFFHYRNFLLDKSWELSHIEEVYYPIFNFCGDSYYLLRLIIWGGAVLLFLMSLKYLPIEQDLTILCFIGVCVSKFAYGRVSLPMTMSLLGVAIFFSKNKKSVLNYIIGSFIVFVSSYFHSSMVFGIAMIVLSVLTINMGKKTLVMTTLGLAVLIIVFQTYAGGLIVQMVEESEDSTSFGNAQSYLYNNFKGNEGFSMFIQTLFERIPLYLLLVELVVLRWKGECDMWPKSIKVLSNLAFWTIIAATVFSLRTTVNTYTFYYRFLNFSYIPASIVLSYFISNKIRTRINNFIYYTALIGSFYILFLCTVHAYTGGLVF